MILSANCTVVESTVVVVPCTSKFPDKVKLVNVGLSPVCRPKSTSAATPLVVSLAVPCEGELRTEADIVLSGISAAIAAAKPSILSADTDPDTICPPFATTI